MKTKILSLLILLSTSGIGYSQITGTISLDAGSNTNLGCWGTATYNLGNPQATITNIPWSITSTYWEKGTVTQGAVSINTSTNVLTWNNVTSVGLQTATIYRKVVFNGSLVFSDNIVLGLDGSCLYDKPIGKNVDEVSKNTNLNDQVVIYPVPSISGKFNIRLDKEYENLSVIVTSMDGNKLYHANYENLISSIELDLSGINGNYIIQVLSNNKLIKRTVINL